MASAIASPQLWTATDLAERFGPMPLARIRFVPPLGSATEEDVLAIHRREHRLCELIDGILVEKPMGIRESFLAMFLGKVLWEFCQPRNLGAVTGADGMMRLAPGLVRIPDLAFIPWDRFPNRQISEEPIPDLAPDLAVEVLSPSNTKTDVTDKSPILRKRRSKTLDFCHRFSEKRTFVGHVKTEMRQKLVDYFNAQCRLVWLVDPEERTVTVYTSLHDSTVLSEKDTLDGGVVLPGFSLQLREFFSELDPH